MLKNTTGPARSKNAINTVRTENSIKEISVFVIGCGLVGGELLEQFKKQQQKLLQRNNINLIVYGIANTSSFITDPQGIDLACWKLLLGNNYSFCPKKLMAFIHKNKLPNPVVIDCTNSEKIAMQYCDFLGNGLHVVTANKIANGKPIDYYNKLRETAHKNNAKFLYETNIGAGLPVVDPLQKLLKTGDSIIKFKGILSGSLSYIFGQIHKGLTLSEAITKAKKLGYTEPDPREDLSGLDVARKVLIIAREMGLFINLTDIRIEPAIPKEYNSISTIEEFMEVLPQLDSLFSERIEKAESEKRVLRYVATIDNNQCAVSIEAISESDPLYEIIDGENILVFYSNYYHPKPLIVRGYGAGAAVTAAGVFSDILRIIE